MNEDMEELVVNGISVEITNANVLMNAGDE